MGFGSEADEELELSLKIALGAGIAALITGPMIAKVTELQSKSRGAITDPRQGWHLLQYRQLSLRFARSEN